MAPNRNVKSDKDARLKAVLSFANSIPSRVALGTDDSNLISEVRTQLKQFPLTQSASTIAHAVELDAKGTELWNLATRVKRDDANPQTGEVSRSDQASRSVGDVAYMLRVFAFQFLDTAWQALGLKDGRTDGGRAQTLQATVRVMKVALKAGKSCVAQDDIEMGSKVAERAAVFAEELGKMSSQDGKQESNLSSRLRAEYFVLRTILAWKQSRLDLAEHLFSKAELDNLALDPVNAEDFADTLLEIGKDVFEKGHFETSALWLERAYDVLSRQEPELLSLESGEVKMTIMQQLVKALLRQQNEAARTKAVDYVNLMDSYFPDKMLVALLKLDIILSEEQIDADRYHNVVIRLVRSVILTPGNMRTLLYHVHKLKDIRAFLAQKVLDELLCQRLLSDSGNEEWIEKVLVTRVWVSISKADLEDLSATVDLGDLFNLVYGHLRQPLSVTATHAAQTLLWKRVERNFSIELFEECEAWCRLCLHKLLDNCGDINKAKVGRKLIMCSFSRQDLNAARQAFFNLPESGREAPLTRFLIYRLALRDNDLTMAAESLDVICRAASEDATILYGCVLEAQSIGDKHQTGLALKRVLHKYEHRQAGDVHLPALLRCMVRLLIGDGGEQVLSDSQTMEQVCEIFEVAVMHARKESTGSDRDVSKQKFDIKELEWFSRSNYNLALTCYDSVHPEYLLRLLTACCCLFECLLQMSPSEAQEEQELRMTYCMWLTACAQITIARAEDNRESSSQAYLAVRNSGIDFRSRLQRLVNSNTISEDVRDDLLDKRFSVLKFELEAALKLRQWDNMEGLFDQFWSFDSPRDAERCDTLADLVLVIHAAMIEAKLDATHSTKMLAALQMIVNRTVQVSAGDAMHIARWLRCMFQIALGFDEAISLHCLEQAHEMAEKRRGSSNAFPSVDLEWLATTAFNRAVDYYCASDDAKTKIWAEKALLLGRDVEDGGALLKLLNEKYSGLSWDS